jgi:hypothetical protein
MATSTEYTFMTTVAKAEGVRQAAKAAAFATWAYGAGSALTTYLAALVSADDAYTASVKAAVNTAANVGISVPNTGPSSQVGMVTLNNSGYGPPPSFAGSLSTTLGQYA